MSVTRRGPFQVGVALAAVLALGGGCAAMAGAPLTSASAATSSAAPTTTGPAIGSTVPAAELGDRMTKAILAERTVRERVAGSGGAWFAEYDFATRPASFRIVKPDAPDVIDAGEYRQVGGIVYAKSDAISPTLPGDKTWIKVPSTVTNPAGRNLRWTYSYLAEFTIVGPLLLTLGSAPVTVTSAAEGETGYAIKLSKDQYVDAVRELGSDDEQAKALSTSLKSGTRELKFAVDDRGLLTRVDGLVSLDGTLGSATFDSWGEPVTIAPPPSAETYTVQ